MAVKADSKLLAELRRQILFYNENFLRPFDIRTELFHRERGNQAELDVIYLPAFCFQTFPRFFQRAISGSNAYKEQVAVRFFMGCSKRLNRFGNGSELSVALFHFHHTVALSFRRFAEYIMFKACGKEHAIFHAGNCSWGNTVFRVSKTVEIRFRFHIQFRKTFRH